MRTVLGALLLVTSLACGPGSASSPLPPAEARVADQPRRSGAAEILDAAPALAQHTVDADGHTLAVWAKSPREPVASLLLVHGRTWSSVPDFDLQVAGEKKSLMDALVGRGIATYAVDLRGYGGTPRDASGWLTPGRAARDVDAVLVWIAARDGRVPAVLGWSMGALVAQLAAQRDPSRMSAMILYGYPRDPGEKPAPSHAGAPGEPPKKPNTREAAASDFVTPGSISQAAIDAYVDAALRADPVRADWTALGELAELDASRVRVPTLVIHGDRDPIAPVAAQGRLFTRLGHPDRAWVVLPDCDHAAHLERCAARFVDAVAGFVLRPLP